MANTLPPSPNMSIVLPVVLGEVGPLWASELNEALGTTVDAHDHTSGAGVRVPSAGININADLSYTGFGPVAQKYSRFASQAFPGGVYPAAGTLPYSLFVGSDGNLYFQNTNGVGSGSGANVKLTSGDSASSVAGATAGFTGDYNNTTTASAYYNAVTTPVYAFFSTPSPLAFNPTTYSANSVNDLGAVWARGYVALGATITTTAFRAATAQSAATNADGFQFAKITGARGFVLATSTTGAGAQGFDQPAFYVKSVSTTNAFVGMNVDTAGPQAPAHARLNAASASAVQEIARLEAYNNTGVSTSTGYGGALNYYGSIGASVTPALRGRVAFREESTGAGGIFVQDTTNVGAANATPVLSSNGGGAYGLGVAVIGATSAGIYAGATLQPFVDATYDLGATALRWANGYFNSVNTPVLAVATATDLVFTPGSASRAFKTSVSTTDLGTTAAPWQYAHVQRVYYTNGGAEVNLSTYANTIYAAGLFTASTGALITSAGFSGISSSASAGGAYTLTLAAPLTSANIIATASCQGGFAAVAQSSASQIIVTTYDTTGAPVSTKNFSVIILGAS